MLLACFNTLSTLYFQKLKYPVHLEIQVEMRYLCFLYLLKGTEVAQKVVEPSWPEKFFHFCITEVATRAGYLVQSEFFANLVVRNLEACASVRLLS